MRQKGKKERKEEGKMGRRDKVGQGKGERGKQKKGEKEYGEEEKNIINQVNILGKPLNSDCNV